MIRGQILSFTRKYIDKHGEPPSIRDIAEGVDGVDRKSFYHYYRDKKELLVELGIKKEVIKPTAAIEARRKAGEKGGDYLVTLNRAQSEKLIALAYMDGTPVSMVVNDLLDEQRQIRQIITKVNGGELDSEIIKAILHPEHIYRGVNVSQLAGRPWVALGCRKCGTPVFIRDGHAAWRDMIRILDSNFKTRCANCQPQSPIRLRGR